MIKKNEEINKEKKGPEQKIIVLEKDKIKDIEISKNSVNNELVHAVNIFLKKYPEKLKKN